MLLGIWKNIEDLEENINLEELNTILKSQHEKERNNQRFLAALKGITLDEDAKERFEAVQARAEARLAGEIPAAKEDNNEPMGADDLAVHGIDFE